MATKEIKISKCVECQHHKIIADPDPHDWFCGDDEAVVCTKTKKEASDIKKDSKYASDRQELKVVEGSCRPYQTKDVDIPNWCPL